MASEFLKRKAEERAKKIDKEFGKGTYGSTADLKKKTEATKKTSTTEKSSSTKSGGAETEKPKSKASSFLQNKAKEQKQNATSSKNTEKGGNKDSWFKDSTYSFNDYSSAVKYLNDKGVSGASGIMTEREWLRRNRSGGTYQDYLNNQVNKYGKGNIDLTNRPVYINSDNTISTVDSVTVGIDGKQYLLPSIVSDKNGKAKRLKTTDDIVNHYKTTGEYLGVFDTEDEANRYGVDLHNSQADYYGKRKHLAFENDGETLYFGNVTEDGYKAIMDGNFANYKPKDAAERLAIAEFAKWATEEAKRQRNPESWWKGILHSIPYSLGKVGAGAVDFVGDIGDLGLAAISGAGGLVADIGSKVAGLVGSDYLENHFGQMSDEMYDNAEYRLQADTLGDMWNASVESRYRVPDWYRDNVGQSLMSAGSMAVPIAVEFATKGLAPTEVYTTAQLAKMATTASATKSAGIAQATKNLANKLITPSISTHEVLFGLGATASSTKEAYKETGNVGKSLTYGVLNGLGEVATERLFGGYAGTGYGSGSSTITSGGRILKVLPDVVDPLFNYGSVKYISKFASTKFGSKVLDLAFEGVEEGIMAWADPIFRKATINSEKGLKELYGDARFGEAFFQGILLSSIMNAGQYAIGKPIQKFSDHRAKVRFIDDLNIDTKTINETLPEGATLFEPLGHNATQEEIEQRYSELERVITINGINKAIDAVNSIVKSEESKIIPLGNDATIEEIQQRQKELMAFGTQYADLMAEELVENNPEAFGGNEATKTPSNSFVNNQPDTNPIQEEKPLKTEFQVANEKANEAAFEAGRQNIPREKVNLTTLEQEEAYNRGRIVHIKNMPKATTKSSTETTNKTILGDGEKSIGVANGQAYVTNGKDILPSPTNRSVFIPVDNVEVAKTELGATESNKTSENISKILASDFTPVREDFVDGTLENVGEVRVFTDENGREIALEKSVAEYFEDYNLEATFRGGKPYAIKATDNNGKVVGVAMAVWVNESGQNYKMTATEGTNTIQTENTVKTAKNTVRDDIVNSRQRQTFTLGELNEISEADETLDVQEVRDVTGYGEKGAELVTKYANYEGVSLGRVMSEVEDAYFEGFENPNKPMGKFETKAQEQAYKAGQEDKKSQLAKARDNSKKATIYKGAFTENEYTKNFTKAEKTMISIVAKALKMDISVVDKIIANEFTGQEANAEHQNGKMRISSTAEQIAQKVLYKLVMHESGHRLKQLAPDEFGVLMDALYERSKRENAKSGRYQHAGFDNVKSDYENADLAMSNESMDTLDYFEEFAVRELETIFSSAREFNKWYAEISGNKQVKSAWDKFVDFILDAIDSIKRKLQLATMSKDERAKANKSLAELDRIKGLLANTYKAAESAVAEKNGTVVDAFGSMKSLIEKGLEADAILEGRKTENIPKILEEVKSVLGTETEGKRFSLKDSEYLELAKDTKKNEARLHEMVYEAAKEGGYPVKVFHGTTGFGFTKADVRKSDDGISFFATDSLKLAQTYSGVLGQTPIKGERYSAENKQRYDNLVNSFVDKVNEIAGRNLLKTNELPFEKYLTKIKKGKMSLNQLSSEMTSYTIDLIDNIENISTENDRLIWELSTELETALYGMNGKSGNYGLYANTDGFLEIEGNGAKWSSIPFDKIPSKTTANTREIVRWAKDNGYNGVLFKNIYDIGYHGNTQENPANVYAFLNPKKQLKSAEPITYNVFGKVIPLSERFNENNKDIRYSLKDSNGKTLTKEQQEYFKDSKVRDDNGNLLVVYHGSPSKFTVFEHDHINTHGNSHGRGFYFTEKKSRAEGYGKEGGQLLQGYLNITNPLSEDKVTIKKSDLVKLIKATCNEEAHRLVDDGYANVKEALPDTWISNYVDTYSTSLADAYKEVANIIYSNNDNDVEIIAEITNSGAGTENTLRLTNDILGYDGVIYTANDGTHEFVSLVSNQFKDINNTKPTSNPDINFSLKGGLSDTEIRKAIADKKLSKYVEKGTITTEKYNELIEKYGVIPSGERPHRDIQVPQKSGKKKNVSQTVRTILEAEATPDEAVPTIEKMVEDGIFSYDTYTDKQAINDAENYIKEYGWDESLDDWFDAVNKGEVSKELTATGWALYNNAANLAATTTSETERTTAIKTSLKILDAMVRHQRSAAQALQATRILKKLSPETQLYGVQKSVSALQKELTDKYGDKAPNLKIDEKLAEQFLNAKTSEERAKIEEKIYKDIGRQMPSRFIDKWNAWRYLAMLGNVRTHGRNIIGNAAFAPVVLAKNLTATAIESVVYRVSGKKMLRGKALITGNKADKALLKAAWGDFKNVSNLISNGGKYNDAAMNNQHIEDGRRIFKFKPLEWARKKNSQLLELEDMWFSQPHYAYALAQYCKANNITAEQISRGKAIAPARDYAIKEAQKATYRDTNAFSQMVSGWGRSKKDSNVIQKAFNTTIEGILPFRKTPANILVRGVEYSPLGLLKGLTYDLYQASKGKMSATDVIDNISAGLTGTGLLSLGIYLAAQGLIRGHGEEEEEEKGFKELMGHQSYALELPNGQSITLDWLAPEALPFFVGVNIWETSIGTDEKANLSTILKSVSNISEPMLELSCLQSLNDLFESVGYATSNDTSGLMSILSSAATSYLTQGIPTLLGQAERTGEENRMTTYTEKDNFFTGDMQYTLGKASAKIPYWDFNQIPYIDAWGRKEASGTKLKRGLNNFLNPAYTSKIETSNMENELLRLYEETGESSVFPSRADKYFVVDGVRKDLTADEYVRYATLKGEKSYKAVNNLVNSKAYKELTDKEKAKAIAEAYDYANQKAKDAISNYKPDSWVNKTDDSSSSNFISFKVEVSSTKDANDGKITKEQAVDIILDTAQNDSQKWQMYLSMYDSKTAAKAEKHDIDAELFMAAVVDMAEIKADYKANGKVVSGSRRKKIERYLNSVCDSYKEYLFLLGMEYDSVKDDADYISYFGKEEE